MGMGIGTMNLWYFLRKVGKLSLLSLGSPYDCLAEVLQATCQRMISTSLCTVTFEKSIEYGFCYRFFWYGILEVTLDERKLVGSTVKMVKFVLQFFKAALIYVQEKRDAPGRCNLSARSLFMCRTD